MEIEGLFEENEVLLYFISVLYILLNDTFSKNQKIISIYIFSYCLKLFDIMSLKVIISIIVIVTFLYSEFLSSDEVKNRILTNLLDKIKDYIYKLIFEFSGIYFIISMIFFSATIEKEMQIISYLNLNIPFLQIQINLISFIFLAVAINNISSCKYSTYNFSTILTKMDNITTWQNTYSTREDKEKMNILVDIEDKSFFIRNKTYNFCSIEFLKYKLGITKSITKIKLNKNESVINIIKRILLKKIYINNIIRTIKKFLL